MVMVNEYPDRNFVGMIRDIPKHNIAQSLEMLVPT